MSNVSQPTAPCSLPLCSLLLPPAQSVSSPPAGGPQGIFLTLSPLLPTAYCLLPYLRINLRILCMLLDEFPAWRNLVAHQHREDMIRLGSTVNCNLP